MAKGLIQDVTWRSTILVSFETFLIVAAIGVVAAFGQLWLSRRQARAAYEDALVGHYRDIVRELPVEALLGERLNESAQRDTLGAFFRYFDLSNEQLPSPVAS